MVDASASVNLPLHHKVQNFSSGTGSPGWSRKKGHKTVVVWCGFLCLDKPLRLQLSTVLPSYCDCYINFTAFFPGQPGPYANHLHTSLQTDNHASTSPLSLYRPVCPSCHPTNSVKTLKLPVLPFWSPKFFCDPWKTECSTFTLELDFRRHLCPCLWFNRSIILPVCQFKQGQYSLYGTTLFCHHSSELASNHMIMFLL